MSDYLLLAKGLSRFLENILLEIHSASNNTNYLKIASIEVTRKVLFVALGFIINCLTCFTYIKKGRSLMKNQKLKIIAASLFVITGIFTLLIYQPNAQDINQQEEEATPVQRGQTTEKEREYSKEIRRMYPFREGIRFGELIRMAEARGNTTETIGVGVGDLEVGTARGGGGQTPAEFLRKISCGSDVVVIGSVRNKAAHMTDDETFVYTEHEFVVQEVLKNNPAASPIQPNNIIQIVRPGGLILLDNRRIRASDNSYELLQKNKSYLLFLKYVSSARGFIVASREGDFIFENNSLRKLTKQRIPAELRVSAIQPLIRTIREVVGSGCQQTPIRGDE